MIKLIGILIVLSLLTINGYTQRNVNWKMIHPGIWKLTVGIPEKISLLKAASIHPYLEGFNHLPKMSFPFNQPDIKVEQKNGKIFLRFPLKRNEQIYGFGLNFQSVNQRGKILNLHVDHYGNEDNGRTHAPVPFYVSSAGYGVLVDAAKYMTVYVGTGVRSQTDNPPVLYNRNTDANWDPQPYSDAIEILVTASGVELYVFAGPSPMQVVQRYNLMNGGGYLPPKWGLGFTQRVPTLFSDKAILNEVDSFRVHQFPLDFIGVEPGWQSMAYPCTFEWDQNRFPNPKGFVDSLLNRGVRANLWFNPYVSPKATMYPMIKKYAGSHTVWNGIVPDFTLTQTKQLFKKHFLKTHLNIGVSGYKIDEVDGYDNWLWPDVANFPSNLSGEQMRQVYGLLVQEMTASWFKEKNVRTYGLVRASNAGASSFPYVLYNDNYSHQNFITALVNSGFAGVLWTPEVRASKTAEEWLRRMQTVCFSPMAMLNAWADGTKPWSFPEVEEEVKSVAYLRMQLLPYLYSSFAQYKFEGKPVFRAMTLVEDFDWARINKDISDQYMMGDHILVAPLFTGEKSRNVYLPKGKWYDFYTGELVGENEMVKIQPSTMDIPLFVRDGALIPMITKRLQAPTATEILPLTVRHYGSAKGEFILYDDDGTTFNYEKGAFSFTLLAVTKNQSGQLVGSIKLSDKSKPFGYSSNLSWEFMTK